MDRAYRGNIIERKKRAERTSRREQLSRYFVAQLRGRGFTFELPYQPGIHGKAHAICHPAHGVPANFRVRAERMPLNERDFLMAQLGYMLKTNSRPAIVLQHN